MQGERPGDLFERLWLLRRWYPLRSAYDSVSTLTIAEAIDHGERMLRLAHLHERRPWRDSSRQAA